MTSKTNEANEAAANALVHSFIVAYSKYSLVFDKNHLI